MTNLERSLSQGDAKPFELRFTNGELLALLALVQKQLGYGPLQEQFGFSWRAIEQKLEADFATRV